MVHQNDKYAEEEENLTQVRSIIKQLNEDKPAQERVREVVVRADGTKVVRVTKKRRVMMSSADVRRRNRKHILLFLAAFLLVMLGCGAYFLFRMSTMSSTAYLAEQQAALQQSWGAGSVQLEGEGINGTTLKLESIVVDFPESSMLQRVELSGVQAKLDVMSFLTGVVKGETLEIDRTVIVLRNGATMSMPRQAGMDRWSFRRMECKDFSVRYADGEAAPVQLDNTQAYMYYPQRNRASSVVMFRGGNMKINGWKTVRVAEGKAHISAQGIEDFSISGTTDAASNEAEQRHTSLAFAGRMMEGDAMMGPFALEADNMSFADFTEGRFEEFLTARTEYSAHGKLNGKFTMNLVRGGGSPLFKGEVHLKGICLSSFPAMMAIREHIEPVKRRLYNPISLHRGYVILGGEDGQISVEIPEGAMSERDLASLSGKMVLNSANELSGELRYGIPLVLARVEYPDGHPDPIFTAGGEWAVLHTRLKGRGNMPGDDMAEVEARAAIARRERPARIPFDKLDVNQLTDQYLNNPSATLKTQEPVQFPSTAPSTPGTFETSSDNPFEVREDPFAPTTVPF